MPTSTANDVHVLILGRTDERADKAARRLSRHGYAVTATANTERSHSLIRTERPDIVLVDADVNALCHNCEHALEDVLDRRPLTVRVALDSRRSGDSHVAPRATRSRSPTTRLAALFHDATELVLALDDRSVIVYANPLAASRYGRTPDAMIGELGERFVDIGPWSPTDTPWPRATASTARPVFRAPNRGCTILARAAPLVVDGVALDLVIGRLSDAPHTASLFDDHDAWDAVTGVAHDCRNILGGVSACHGLLEIHVGDRPEARRVLASAEDLVRTSAALLERLFATRVATDQPIERIDLGEFARKLLPALDGLMRSPGQTGARINVGVSVDDGDHLVLGRRADLEQIVLNLFLNARDALPDGGDIELRIESRLLDATPRCVLIVCDNGRGMDEASVERAFDLGFTTNGTGRGLGLHVVRRCAESMGGIVDIQTRFANGTTVFVSFPAATDHVDHGRDPGADQTRPSDKRR